MARHGPVFDFGEDVPEITTGSTIWPFPDGGLVPLGLRLARRVRPGVRLPALG